MLYDKRIDVSERVDIMNQSHLRSKKCIICHFFK